MNNKEKFKDLNIPIWQGVTTGKGVKVGILGYGSSAHHDGAYLINQVAPYATIIEYPVMEGMKWSTAFEKMIEDEVDIVCCSLRKGSWPDEYEGYSKQLYERGVVMIDSADNEGKEIDAYPAKSKYWFVAGAYDPKKNSKAGYSSFGMKLDFLMHTSFMSMTNSGNMVPISHTSGATQVPAGMVALLKEHTENRFGPAEFKRFIAKYSRDLEQPGFDKKTGHGLLCMPEEVIYPVKSVVHMDVPATITKGRFCTPDRFITEALGGEATWDAETETATLIVGNTSIKMKKGSKDLKVEVLDLC